MIISSIDLMDGRAVQLRRGKELVLDGGDPIERLDAFAVAGEVAVVDLDAAMGKGSNTDLMREMVRRAPCRVGGGIRDADSAKAWLDAGATKVVIGTAASVEFCSQLPRDRVVAAVDAEGGTVVIEGWQTRTGYDVVDRISELVGSVGGFLLTQVEREGEMGGFDRELVERAVEAAGGARVTAAGGITTTEEVAELDRMGADAQVGMALYTDRLSLGAALGAPLHKDIGGLWPTVVCTEDGTALGLAWSSRESLEAAVAQRRGIYWSRSRSELWVKGETSGATQDLLRVDLDCDRDALRFTVRQHGTGFCHTGELACWPERFSLSTLERVIAERVKEAPASSGTARLVADADLLNAKLKEEASELADAANAAEVVHEAADLLYFTMVAAGRHGVGLEDVRCELKRRHARVSRRPMEAKPEATGVQETSEPVTQPEGVALPHITVDEFLARRRTAVPAAVLAEARAIVERVRNEGEVAVREYAVLFGDRELGESLYLTGSDLQCHLDALSVDECLRMERIAGRVRTFAAAQRECLTPLAVNVVGGSAGHGIDPVASAGCYAPGGRYPLPSSVLMTAVTARTAGVGSVWVASPRPAPITLAAAAVAGVDGVLAVGGAQAIAALAFGCGPVPASDVVVGPGNRYVTAAKQLIAGQVAIDMLAGPSELVVIADGSADPAWVAADLLAQAEHDADAVPILIGIGDDVGPAVEEALETQLADLPTADTAVKALRNGGLITVTSLDEALAAADALAPEHLQLSVAAPEDPLDGLGNCGAVFLGERSAEVLGDYGVGPNHVLPTGGTARSRGGLSVLDFLRVRTWMQIRDADAELLADVAWLARQEGLEAHARAAELRGS